MYDMVNGLVIKGLRIENIGPFYGNHTIDFIEDGMNIIYGRNGYGKSTIFRAIYTALFASASSMTGEIINKRALKEGVNKGVITIHINIFGKDCTIERYIRPDGGIIVRSMTGTLQTLYNAIPPTLANYFLFDGETIRNWISACRRDTWENAEILGLGPYLTVISDFGRVVDALKTDIERAKSDPKYLELINTRNAIMNQLNDINTELNRHRHEYNNICELEILLKDVINQKEKIHEINVKMRDVDTKIRGSEESLKSLEKRITRAMGEMPYAYLYHELRECVKLVIDMKGRVQDARLLQGRLASQVDLLDEIRHKRQCVCGTPLSTTSYGRKAINGLISELTADIKRLKSVSEGDFWSYTELMDALARTTDAVTRVGNISASIDKVKKLKIDIGRYRDTYHKLVREKSVALGTLKNMAQRFKIIGIDLFSWETERIISEFERMRGKLEGEIFTLEHMAQELKDKVTELNTKIKGLEENINGHVSTLERAITMAEGIKNDLEKAVQRHVNSLFLEIERSTDTIFKSIINKSKDIGTVKLTGNRFGIVMKNGDYICSHEMSDGEKHVLAISIMAALQKFCGSDTLIIDGPFGRLDKRHRQELIAQFPSLARQVIMFITDYDYDNIKTAVDGKARIMYLDRNSNGSIVVVEA